MAEEDFAKAVDDGLKLSKRLRTGKDRAVAPPQPPPQMEKTSSYQHIPTAPMVYAVISDPGIVDNPDVPSYQPHVHGRCDPPVLIPLQMNGIELEVDCYLDTAFVRVSGSWRVHCVMGSQSCDCRIAIPMGEQGSILGVEVEVPRKSYSSQLIGMQDNTGNQKAIRDEDGGFLKPHIFTLTIPQIDGGTNISIKLSWSQKLLYNDGQFTVSVPYSFPDYVTPVVKKITKKEKIHLNVNTGTETEVLIKTSSHPLKEKRRHVGKLGFFYESEVFTWSKTDLNFSYAVSSRHTVGGVHLHSPSVHDTDRREMFGIYLVPGSHETAKVFRKEVIFVIDISESMFGKPLEGTKNAITAALSKLNVEDSFNIIAFNDQTHLFSTSMELATSQAVERSIQWIGKTFIAGGGTNISSPLQKALEILSNTRGCIPLIFLVTDGAVEDERQICDVTRNSLTNGGSLSPRIYSFGIGTFCNHYFLRTLAKNSGGQHGAAYDLDSIELQMDKFFTRALCTVIANITIDTLSNLDNVEVYPSYIPDLSSTSPLIISGRYEGEFPDSLKVKGFLGDLSNIVIDLKSHREKEIPLDMVLAKQQIDVLAARAWFSEDKQLEEKVAKLSIHTGFASEYTRMVLLETIMGKKPTDSARKQKVSNKSDQATNTIHLHAFSLGFGNISATTENIRPGLVKPKLPDAAEMFARAASNCCGSMCRLCCCMCCIETCSNLNDRFVTLLAQMCTALAFIGCFECCSLCCGCGDNK